MQEITQEYLKSILRYEPETGDFYWNISKKGIKKGKKAGCIVTNKNYKRIEIGINYKNYKAHRLAWLYIYGIFPSVEIDHINCNALDNRICNLRLAIRRQNAKNRKPRKNKRYQGVSYDKERKKFIAKIMVDYKAIYLGRYNTKEEAIKAYENAHKFYHQF